MKLILILSTFTVASCAPQAFTPGTPNPLDEPGQVDPTVDELHEKNIRIIKGFPL